jgi:hypothetical protein
VEHTDRLVCGGWQSCEFCPLGPPRPTLRSVLWDYWAAGILAGVPEEATRDCELIERLVLPLLGELEPAAVTDTHRGALRFVLKAQGLDERQIKEVDLAFGAFVAYARTA